MPSDEDLTARARIRDAALQHFAAVGFEQATIRDIARTAGVSPGLLRHHFGSKDELRVACDEYVAGQLRWFNDHAVAESATGSLRASAAGQPAMRRFQRYISRAMVDGSATAATLFDEMTTLCEQWLVAVDQDRVDQPADRRLRAALITAMSCGIALLHTHIDRAAGVAMYTPQGDNRIADALLDLYSHRLISPDLANSARDGLAAAQKESTPDE
jgi:AcrR family transcriptional regulator